MAEIKCPTCGEINTVGAELCSNCNSPLQPKENIQSGQAPTKKHTAELEPILPQWLKAARDAARNVESEDDTPDFMQANQEKQKAPISPPDFLAGLQAQTGDDEEDEDVPSWLANITGASPKSKPAKDEISSDIRWVEMGDKDDFAQSENILTQQPSATEKQNEEDVPIWLAGLHTDTQSEKDELTDWLQDTNASNELPPLSIGAQFPNAGKENDEKEDVVEPSTLDDTPDWLKQMSDEAQEKSEQDTSSQPTSPLLADGDIPAWFEQLSNTSAEPIEAQTPRDAPELSIDTPNWLEQLPDTSAEIVEDQTLKDSPELSGGTPNWLNALNASEENSKPESAEVAEPSIPTSEAFSFTDADIPEWLKSPTEPQDKKQDTTPAWLKSEDQSSEFELPAWLASEDTVRLHQPQAEEPVPDSLLSDLPDWLKSAAPETTIFDTPTDEAEVNLEETQMETKSSVPEAESVDPYASMPAFVSDAQNSESIESLFTEMPDWLSRADEQPADLATTTNEDILPSNDLPSWVEAMRPNNSGLGQISSAASDQSAESHGALAGLQGVLPAGVGFNPTSKPKVYSLKLNVDDEQQRQAGILEDILAAETSPVPIASFGMLRSSRGLRWTLAFLMLAVVLSTTLLNIKFFSLPQGLPSEINSAIQVMQSIPENAPVLVVFDYEPSRASEMEVVASPVFDQLLLLKHPRLTFISTNETGAMLAERFIAGPLAGHSYQNSVTYSNLGYLPGGQLGVRAFAQNPSLIAPFDINLQPAWGSAPLQDVSLFSHFATLILITDNADAARVWIEQTQGLRGNLPFIIISSAQSTPLIQPYYASGQVNGIVSGLYGGALFEQYNAGRPGTARNYWDAYTVGMLLATVLVGIGGLWNVIVGLRERGEGN